MKIIIANWKMNGDVNFAKSYAAEITSKLAKTAAAEANLEVVVCPPFPYLGYDFAPFKKGAQDCYHKERGPFTGDVAPYMLKDSGAEYVIVGHSERRYVGETSENVAGKAACAHKAGLKAIICIGENKGDDREAVLKDQIKKSVPLSAHDANTIIAYEPNWAIGTGKTPSAEEIEQVHQFIKSLKPLPVLYGGSVKAENAAELLSLKNVDGLLVGGASLDTAEFAQIVGAAK